MGLFLGREAHFSNIWAEEFAALPPKLFAGLGEVSNKNNVGNLAYIKNQDYASEFSLAPKTVRPLPATCHT